MKKTILLLSTFIFLSCNTNNLEKTILNYSTDVINGIIQNDFELFSSHLNEVHKSTDQRKDYFKSLVKKVKELNLNNKTISIKYLITKGNEKSGEIHLVFKNDDEILFSLFKSLIYENTEKGLFISVVEDEIRVLDKYNLKVNNIPKINKVELEKFFTKWKGKNIKIVEY